MDTPRALPAARAESRRGSSESGSALTTAARMRASAIRISEYQPREEDYDAYQAQVQYRFQAQVSERCRGPRLDREVPGYRVANTVRSEGVSDQRRRVRDHAIEDYRYPVDGAHEYDPGDRPVLQATERGQGTYRIFRVRLAQPQGL